MSLAIQTLLIFSAMIAGFFVATWVLKMPSALALLVAALMGFVGGIGEPIRHIFEGVFGYFDIVVIVLTAAIFIAVQRESKGLNTIVRDIIKVFHKVPPLLLILLMFVVILPGALAGSGTAAVMAVGGLVGSVLIQIGLSKVSATSFVAMGGILALLAPPVNLPAMIVSSGLNMPYSGFMGPLMVVTLILGVFCSLFYGMREVDKKIDYRAVQSGIVEGTFRLGKLGAYLPLLVVVGLMVIQRTPIQVPDPGVPMIFVIGTIVALLVNKEKINFVALCKKEIKVNGPVAAIFVAVGVLAQIMVTTGVRGLIVIESITAPVVLLLLGVAFLLPAMGGIMGTYGVASIFAIPFMMSLLSQDVIYGIAGLSIICSLASLTPPTGIVGRAAMLVTDYKDGYGKILKASIIPWIVVNASGMIMIIFANWFSQMF